MTATRMSVFGRRSCTRRVMWIADDHVFGGCSSMMKGVAVSVLVTLGCSGTTMPDAGDDVHDPSPWPADLASPPCAGRVGFSAAPTMVHPTSAGFAMRVADLDGDGVSDLLSYTGVRAFSVQLGTSYGTFGAEKTLIVPLLPGATYGQVAAVESADFDGDGRRDFVFVYTSSGGTLSTPKRELRIFRDGGNGSYAPWRIVAETSAIPSDFDKIGIADLNGDGTPDLTVMIGGTTIGVWLSTPGTYAAEQLYPVTGGVLSFELGDVTGDNVPDMIAAGANHISMFVNSGTGVLGAQAQIGTALWPTHLALIDLNGDAKLDLVYHDTDSSLEGLGVMLAQGAGAFGVATIYPASTDLFAYRPVGLRIGDIDGDGHQDVVVGSGSAGLFRGIGNGTLGPAEAWSLGNFAFARFNADNRADVVIDRFVGFGGVLNTGDGTAHPFDLPQIEFTNSMAGARWVDLDGDSVLDLVGIATDIITTRRGLGGGPFSPDGTMFPAIPTLVPVNSVLVSNEQINATPMADMDNDNRPDLLLMGAQIQVVRNNGDGTMTPASPANGGNGSQFVIADFDRDGNRDIVIPSRHPSTLPDTGEIRYLHGHGDGTFDDPVVVWTGNGATAAALDADADGNPDLIVDSHTRQLLRGNGDGTFEAPVNLMENDSVPLILVAHDVNGDGKSDLISSTTVSLNLGNGTFSEPEPIAEIVGWPAFADFNGDGHTDMITSGVGVARLYLGHGDGTFDPPLEWLVDPSFLEASVTTGQLDGDGLVDVLLQGDFSNAAILRGRCL